jgi:hypothetical protein
MGYFEGQNVSVEYRWIADRYDALPAMAADLVQRQVTLIFALGPPAVLFSPDGAYAYIGNFLDSDISILKINGTQVTDAAKKLKLPGHPASLRSAPK